jgi:hypothetical protein
MRKQFFRWATIERAVREYQAHLKTDGIWCGICLQALARCGPRSQWQRPGILPDYLEARHRGPIL